MQWDSKKWEEDDDFILAEEPTIYLYRKLTRFAIVI